MYINYDHGSHKYWKLWFSAKFSKKMAARQPSWIRSVSNFAHWYIQWLCTSFLFSKYINYDHGSHKLWKFWFLPNSAKKMAASRPSWIRSVPNFAHWYIQWLSTSFLFSMYINYDHGSHKLWKLWFSTKFSKKCPPIPLIVKKIPRSFVKKRDFSIQNGHQATIFDQILPIIELDLGFMPIYIHTKFEDDMSKTTTHKKKVDQD